ncbi:MAG: PLDc N-terminal domain-containing protein, partial [Sphingomonadales bacterium]|nr:PLDc N-terminal domain-containing protein [Sphingomonadales bacterium]
MSFSWISTFDLGVVAHFAAQTAVLIRVLLRADREPAVRAGWAVLVFTLPVFGIALYLLIGETRLNQRVARR